jgi:hypothetical protein
LFERGKISETMDKIAKVNELGKTKKTCCISNLRSCLGKAVRLQNWPLHLGGVLEAAAEQLYMEKSGQLPSLERVMKPEAANTRSGSGSVY